MTFDLIAGIVQLVIFLTMSFLLPWSITPTGWGLVRYTIYTIIIWIAYTLVAMAVDINLNTDTPGIAYLFFGFISWILGSALLIHYLKKERSA